MNRPRPSSPSADKSAKERLLREEEAQHHNPPPEPDEDSLDRTIEDSFPASDPPSSIPDPDEDAA